MSALLDSSVLVAALAPDEKGHANCLALLMQGECMAYAHAFLEAFSTLTGGRLGVKVDADLAAKLLSETVQPRVHVVELGIGETLAALRLARKHGVRGGAVYDYMHWTAARKAGAGILYTINLHDFLSLHGEGGPEIRHP